MIHALGTDTDAKSIGNRPRGAAESGHASNHARGLYQQPDFCKDQDSKRQYCQVANFIQRLLILIRGAGCRVPGAGCMLRRVFFKDVFSRIYHPALGTRHPAPLIRIREEP